MPQHQSKASFFVCICNKLWCDKNGRSYLCIGFQ